MSAAFARIVVAAAVMGAASGGVDAGARQPAALVEPAPQPWDTGSIEQPLTAGSPVHHTVWTTSRPPGGAFDRIAVHRYRVGRASRATLLYLPGTNMNGIAALTDEAHNLWMFLAARGVEVFALDYRTRFVPATAEASTLSTLKGWTSSVFVEDIIAAAALARRESGRDRLFVAGFSRGVFLAYAYALAEPQRVAGLAALDGAFKSPAATRTYDRAAALAKLEASGAWASDVSGRLGWEGRQQLMHAVMRDTDGPASDPKFPTIGQQLANLLQFAWRPGGLANPLGGLSRASVLATLLASYDRYYPAVQDVDNRSVADWDDDPSTTLDDGWGKLAVPVVLFASTGMGGEWLVNAVHSAHASGSADVTFNVLERYGHLDVLVADAAMREVFEPLHAWLMARSEARPAAGG